MEDDIHLKYLFATIDAISPSVGTISPSVGAIN
jgi:hypothetical protein